jgi:molecular chaperone DnaK (HSP70)
MINVKNELAGLGIDIGYSHIKLALVIKQNKDKFIYKDSFPSLAYYLKKESRWLIGEDALNYIDSTDNIKEAPLVQIRQLLLNVDKDEFLFSNFENIEAKYNFNVPKCSQKSLFVTVLKYILAERLSKLLDEAKIDIKPDDIILGLTHPDKFSNDAKISLKSILRNLGFPNANLITESGANSVYLGQRIGKVLVCDIGSQSTDLTIRDSSSILDTHEVSIGGEEFDQALQSYIKKQADFQFKEETRKLGYESQPEELTSLELYRFYLWCKQSKEKLSSKESSFVFYPSFTTMNFEVERTTFEQLIEPYVKSIIKQVEEFIKPHDIDQIILSGGSAATPLIKQYFLDFATANNIYLKMSDDIIFGVAIGVAFYGLNINPLALVAPKSYGVSYYNSKEDTHYLTILLAKGTRLPLKGNPPYRSPKVTYLTRKACRSCSQEIYETDYKPNELCDMLLRRSENKVYKFGEYDNALCIGKGNLEFAYEVPVGHRMNISLVVDSDGIACEIVESQGAPTLYLGADKKIGVE